MMFMYGDILAWCHFREEYCVVDISCFVNAKSFTNNNCDKPHPHCRWWPNQKTVHKLNFIIRRWQLYFPTVLRGKGKSEWLTLAFTPILLWAPSPPLVDPAVEPSWRFLRELERIRQRKSNPVPLINKCPSEKCSLPKAKDWWLSLTLAFPGCTLYNRNKSSREYYCLPHIHCMKFYCWKTHAWNRTVNPPDDVLFVITWCKLWATDST